MDWAQTVIDQMPSGLAVISRQGKLLWANATFLSMFPSGPMRSDDWHQNFPEPFHQPLQAFSQLGKNTEFRSVVVELPQPGESLFFMLHMKCLSVSDAILVDVRDYTDRKIEEDHAAQRERLASIGQLSTGIAHEINNPNAFIRLNVGNLKTIISALTPCFEEIRNNSPEQKIGALSMSDLVSRIPDCVESIQRGSERILKVVNTLKGFARNDRAGSAELNLREIVQQVMEFTQYLSRDVSEIEAYVSPDLPPVHGSAVELEQVLINLVTNSWQSIRRRREELDPSLQGLIQLQAEWNSDANEVVLTVTDNGMGIHAKDRQQIFSPFFTTRDRGEGTGLGLALTYKIIQRHGGRIEFESEWQQGATFRICLPVYIRTKEEVAHGSPTVDC